MIAVVREARSRRRASLLSMALSSQLAAVLFAQWYPEFCAQYAIQLSAGVCVLLALISLAQQRIAGPSLICDGRWLARCSWLIGSLTDLGELSAVRARRRDGQGAISEITLCTRKRELVRLDLGQWQGEDLQLLLAMLLESRPQVMFDSQTRLWLQPALGLLHPVVPPSAEQAGAAEAVQGTSTPH